MNTYLLIGLIHLSNMFHGVYLIFALRNDESTSTIIPLWYLLIGLMIPLEQYVSCSLFDFCFKKWWVYFNNHSTLMVSFLESKLVRAYNWKSSKAIELNKFLTKLEIFMKIKLEKWIQDRWENHLFLM
jgi:hypothetical protein